MTIPPENISAGPVAKKYLPVNDGGRLGYAGSEQAGELFGKHRPAEIVTLRLVTLVSLKKHELFLRFHALGDDPQLEASAHADHRGHDGRLVGGGGNLTDKRLVDFEGIDRKLSEVTQTRVTRAEVVDRELHPSRSQCLEDGLRGLGTLHQNAFRQLQLKRSRIQARILEDCEYTLKKVVVSELHRGDIHRHGAQG